MRAEEAVKQIMREKGYTQEVLAKEIGLKRQNSLSVLLNRNDLKCGRVSEILGKMGYKLVVVKDDAEIEGIVID